MANKGAWITLILYLFTIYFFEPMAQELRQFIGDQMIGYITIIAVTAIITGAFFIIVMRQRESFEVYSWLLLVAITMIYIISMVEVSEMPNVVVYTILAILAYYTFKKSVIECPHVKAFGIVVLASILDEVIQLFIPNRNFELLDIELSIVSGALILLIIAVIFKDRIKANNIAILVSVGFFLLTFFSKQFAGFTVIAAFMVVAMMLKERFEDKIKTLAQGRILFFLGISFTLFVLAYDLLIGRALSIGMLQIIALTIGIFAMAKGLELIKIHHPVEIP